MSLLADLRNGTHGIRFILPSSLECDADRETFASFRDPEHRVDWYLEFYPLPVDLSIGQDDVLFEDLRIDTIAVFESYFEGSKRGSGASVAGQPTDPSQLTTDVAQSLSVPRTRRDPTWSPVVSVERVTFGGVPALVVIHRLTYAPGNELIVGRIIIPLEQGAFYFSALRRANTTGVRESVLSIVNSQPSPDADHRPLEISQAAIDDPALDDKFPDHPLSAIRRALRWALGTQLDVTVTAPLSIERDAVVELQNSGCAILLPPRFRFCPRMAAVMDSSLTPFVRATVPQTGSYTFDVWRLPDITVKGRHATQHLRSLAEEHLRGWKRGEDPDFEMEGVECPILEGRPGLRTYVRFHVNGHMNHAVANWFTDHDGRVFRVCAAGPLARSREELMRIVDESTSTWRRLPGDTKARSKWWNSIFQ